MSSHRNIQTPASLTTHILDQPPSCLEFCPDDPDHFVVGTYLLHEDKDDESAIKQTKTGSLQVWHLDAANHELNQEQYVALPFAVFDLHFNHQQPTLLGIAGSDGSVSLYRISRDTDTRVLELRFIWTRPVHEDEHIPALFLAWTPPHWFRHNPTLPDSQGFAVTFSDGRTSVFATSSSDEDVTQGDGSSLIESRFQPRERIEAWFVALAEYTQPETGDSVAYTFTGNDFGSLNVRQFARQEGAGASSYAENDIFLLEELQVSDRDDRARHHAAGVTAILPLPVPLLPNGPVLLTGSYDEYLRVYHATARGAVLAEEQLGGGVWRLQIIRKEDTESAITFLVLASCMHAGTRIVRVSWRRNTTGPSDLGEWDIQIVAQFTEHQSMNYASAVWKTTADSSEIICVSSSFYDRRLCLWKARV